MSPVGCEEHAEVGKDWVWHHLEDSHAPLTLFYIGGSKTPPWLIIIRESLGDAPNGLILLDFVPFSIRKVLGRKFLGFLFEISKKFYVNNFFNIQSKGRTLLCVKMHRFLCPFFGQKW